MTEPNSLPLSSDDARVELFSAICDETATPDQFRSFEELLRHDESAIDQFAQFVQMRVLLQQRFELGPFSGGECEAACGSAEDGKSSPLEVPAIPCIPIDAGPFSGIPQSSSYMPSFFFSYLIAAAVLSVAVLAGWAFKVSGPSLLTRNSAPSKALSVSEMAPFVGRITGVIDCQWADPKTETFNGAHVSQGRRYALAAGLMEITYDTGAKVILEGPCTYEVETKSSGYLSLGKVTARVEKKTEAGRPKENGRESDKADLFAVRTPVAIIRDIGTEFGVEVEKSGVTRSLVYRGLVTLQAASVDGEPLGSAQVLRANESARVEKAAADQGGSHPIVVLRAPVKPSEFVRRMPRQVVRRFDLVDVLAGGDGFSGRRDRGINPMDGRPINEPIIKGSLTSDGQYHRVKELSFVDGVFIPRGGDAPVQVDSAGHGARFPKTESKAVGGIWAGGKDRSGMSSNPAMLGAVDYSSHGHGVIYIHANQGITFDLEAIRRANPHCKVARFLAMAGNSEDSPAEGKTAAADLWVLVDGQVRSQRREINGLNGAFAVSVPITDKDRFLTLVSTDAGNGIGSDWVMFGDARLELISTESPAGLRMPQP